MKLSKNKPVNKNTRKNARLLAKWLKREGLPATAPSKKNDQGVWDVKAVIPKNGTRNSKRVNVVNGKVV